jgi:hypothetical protein
MVREGVVILQGNKRRDVGEEMVFGFCTRWDNFRIQVLEMLESCVLDLFKSRADFPILQSNFLHNIPLEVSFVLSVEKGGVSICSLYPEAP